MELHSDISSIANSLTDLCIQLSPDLTIITFNKSAEKFFSCCYVNMIGKNIQEAFISQNITPPIHADILIEFTKRKLLSGDHIEKHNNRNILWKLHKVRERHILLIGKELDTKKSAFIDSLESIIQCTPGSLYWKDNDGYYLGCNEFMVRTAGLNSLEDIIGKTDYDLWPKSAGKIIENDKFVMASGKTLFTEESVFTDGKLMFFTGVKMPLRDKEDNIIGIIGNSLDITKLKTAENEIAKIKGMGTIGSSIAHELRTPLASINSAANGLKKYFPILLDSYLLGKNAGVEVPEIPSTHFENLLTLLDDIQSELHSANTIINMLLQNIKQPDLKIDQLCPCSMTECIEEAVCRYPFTSDKQAELINLDYEHDFSFMGNQLLMIHVLFNLIKNALYAIEAVGKGEIHIWIESNHNQNILYFRDTGKGIPQSILPKLFDRFFTTSLHGTGLGLAFSKRVMQAFGGNITCESVEGEFTLFKLHFPIA